MGHRFTAARSIYSRALDLQPLQSYSHDRLSVSHVDSHVTKSNHRRVLLKTRLKNTHLHQTDTVSSSPDPEKRSPAQAAWLEAVAPAGRASSASNRGDERAS